MSKGGRPRYGVYGVLLLLLLAGFCGILYFGNILVNFEIYLSIILIGFGAYTLAYTLYLRSTIFKSERNYMLLWGYLLLSLGLAFLLEIFTGNIMLNISVVIVVGAILGILILARRK